MIFGGRLSGCSIPTVDNMHWRNRRIEWQGTATIQFATPEGLERALQTHPYKHRTGRVIRITRSAKEFGFSGYMRRGCLM